MKKILTALLVMMMVTPAMALTVIIDKNTGATIQEIDDGTDKVTIVLVGKSNVSSVSVPSVSTGGSDICRSGVSEGINIGAISASKGDTVVDEVCERIKLSRELYNKGMKVASITVMCQDPRVFAAMEYAGTPCPAPGGLIGPAAQAYWDAHPEERADYLEYIEKLRVYKERRIEIEELKGIL